MATQTIKLISRSEVAFDTMAFHFEKPAHFQFIPGQACDFTLIDPPETDKEGDKRSFSLAAAPYEEDLFIATRMRDSAFKRSLRAVPLGTELSIEPPWGDLTLHDDHSIPAALLTGGIGITAMRSIILQAAHDKLSRKITLFYSNRRPEDTAFLGDLRHAQEQNPNFKLIATMTKMHESPSPGIVRKAKPAPSTRPCSPASSTTLPLPSITFADRRRWSTRCKRCSKQPASTQKTSRPKTSTATSTCF